jgi:pimeloyl-ACP methyl ester carboxylesterase
LDQILDTFRERGFEVTSVLRPREQSVDEAAGRVVAQVRALRQAGVPATHITILGASMGGYVTLLAATRLREPELRVAVLGVCLSERVQALQAREGRPPEGHLLAIREQSDTLTESCAPWSPTQAPRSLRSAREQMLHTGLRHGFLYRPLTEWVEPVLEWALSSEVRAR